MRKRLPTVIALAVSVVGVACSSGVSENHATTGSLETCESGPDEAYEILLSGQASLDLTGISDAMIEDVDGKRARRSHALIENESEWDTMSFRSGVLDPPEPVDFSEHRVAAFNYTRSSTCGVSINVRGCHSGGSLRLTAAVEDGSWHCETVCDAWGDATALVQLPVEDEPPEMDWEIYGGCSAGSE